ncbi:MAG: hypothetical protein VX777_04105 [Chlamydiota bacterium]|nr:hypothetical protein [Chlamydiota bacterium]
MSSVQNPDWIRVAQEFSDNDLQAHPSTKKVMSFFTPNATFGKENSWAVNKTIATIGFKILCEWSTLEIQELWDVSFEEKDDHILWSFKSKQLRKKTLHDWLVAPQWYRIVYAAKLYFTGSGESTKICRQETVLQQWEKLNI